MKKRSDMNKESFYVVRSIYSFAVLSTVKDDGTPELDLLSEKLKSISL